MKTTIGLILVLLFATPLICQDSPDHFGGSVDILLDNGETYHCALVSESLAAGKWRMTFVTNVFADYQSEGYVTIGAHTDGRIMAAVVGFGIMVITPSDPTIRAEFSQAVGAVVTSQKHFTIQRTTAQETEILIESLN
jgi:hypothetical protein